MNIKVLLKWFLEKIKKIIRKLTPEFKEDDSFWDKCTTVYLSIMCVLFIIPMAIFTIIFAVYLWLTFYFCNFEESCPNPEFWKKQEQKTKYEQVFKLCYEEKKLDGTITQDSNLEFVSKTIKDCIGDKDTNLTNLIIPLQDCNLEFSSKAIKDCIEDKDTNLTNLIIPLIYAETMDLL